VVALDIFLDHLFYRPRSCHYYFGDYYDPYYRESGWYASFHWHDSRRGYDPIYTYQRWHHRHDRDWDKRHRDEYLHFAEHADLRPPRTWSAMRALRGEAGKFDRKRDYAESLSDFAVATANTKKFRPLDEDQRDRILSQEKEIRTLAKERGRMERGSKRKDEDKEQGPVVREKLPPSSIVGKKRDESDRSKGGPPPRPLAENSATIPNDRKSPGDESQRKGSTPKEERDARKPDNSPGRPDVKRAPEKESRPESPKKETGPAPKKESRSESPKKETRPAPKKESRADAPM
jgi:hypothetical protein